VSRLGLEHVTVIGMLPPDLVTLAADAGLHSVGLLARQLEHNPFGFPDWSLIEDAALRRELKARLADRGIALGLADFCRIAPELDVSRWQPHIDVAVELGAERININCSDPDPSRSFDQYCQFAEMTRDTGIEVVHEYAPSRGFRRLDDVVAAIGRAGFPHLKLCIDVMHFFRGGHRVEDIARFDPALFSYVQLCDAPLRGEKFYLQEALTQRMIPGEGELPVRALLEALPRGIPLSLEVPHKRLADAGVPPAEIVRRATAASRAMLAGLDAAD
jgi:sugar phosphate isomerase/epimerase